MELTTYTPGEFCFIEAGSTDVAGSRDFYAALLGWEAEERRTPEGGTYTRFLMRAKPVAGMYPLGSEQQEEVIPRHWMSYVSVEDAVATLEKAVGIGATPLGRVIVVPGVVTVAEFIDPTGAACGLWQPDAHIGAVYAHEPGTLIWNELLTRDPEAAAAFYCALFGWTHEFREMPVGRYHLFKDRDERRGGMTAIVPEMADASPWWRVYIAVAELDASMAVAVNMGGSADGNVVEIPGMGRSTEIRDPAGVAFMLMEPA